MMTSPIQLVNHQAKKARAKKYDRCLLWTQSYYSLLRGQHCFDKLAQQIQLRGYNSMLVADRNNFYGLVNAWRAAHRFGLKLIVGVELDEIRPTNSQAIKPQASSPNDKASFNPEKKIEQEICVTLVARSRAAFEHLNQIISARHKAAENAKLTKEAQTYSLSNALKNIHSDLSILCSHATLLSDLFDSLGKERAQKQLFACIQRPAPSISQEMLLLKFAHKHHLQIIAGRSNSLLHPQEASFEWTLEAIREQRTVSQCRKNRSPKQSQEVILTYADFKNLYQDIPKAWLFAMQHFSECALSFAPAEAIFPQLHYSKPETPYSQLYQHCQKGLKWRYPHLLPSAVERLTQELRVIHRMGFVEYFIVVGDIVRFARKNGIECCGRGSGASSIVSYVLGITQVDPLEHDLHFERFLHEGRTDLPDIDIDLCWIGRERVIEYVYHKYGAQYVAMISTHLHFQARSAFRESAKAHGIAPRIVDRISKRIPYRLSQQQKEDLASVLNGDPVLDQLAIDPRQLQQIFHDAKRLLGMPHHLSVHPGGIVIADRPIQNYVPLEKAAKGLLVTQLDMYSIEDIGLVKIDLLGNRCLSEIQECLDLVERHSGTRPQIDKISHSDEKTADLLKSGQALGCFQLESPAMRSLLMRLQCSSLSNTIHAIALVRPGPSEGGMKDQFIACERKEKKPQCLHPKLQRMFEKSHGILLYEEDVMCTIAQITGLSLGEGDQLRREIKKAAHASDKKRLAKLADQFVQLAVKNSIRPSAATKIWQQLERFGRYSFNKAHAASYALLAYQSAYLKAHYPSEFFTAVCNHHAGMYPYQALVSEARRCRVNTLLPCVQKSTRRFLLQKSEDVDECGIRIPLTRIKGLTERSIENILNARPFQGLEDFVRRCKVNQTELSNLIRLGAFDFCKSSRPRLLWQAQLLHKNYKGKKPEQGTLFAEEIPAPDLLDYNLRQKLNTELELLGAGISAHPMDFIQTQFPQSPRVRLSCITIEESKDYSGEVVKIMGIRIASRQVTTKKGQRMGFVTIEDETGLLELVLFPNEWKKAKTYLFSGTPLLVEGRIEEQQNAITMQVNKLSSLPLEVAEETDAKNSPTSHESIHFEGKSNQARK